MSAPDTKPSPLDRALTVTYFFSFAANEKREQAISLRGLVPKIRNTTHTLKAKLPWLKLARFGDKRSAKEGVPADRQSLRHNDNVLAISGIEADYDSEIVTVDQAVAVLRSAGLAGMVYTSPSHTEGAPRWRVLCPLSKDHAPDTRTGLVERLNGLFHGALAGESFTLSQSYYFGSIRSNPSHQVELIDGAYLDERLDLDEGAIGKPRTEYAPTPAPKSDRSENKSKFIEAVIRNALSKVRGAGDGQKHHTLRAQARLLGGYQHAGHYTNTEAVQWLMDALPTSVKDRKAAAVTALWGLEKGAERPIAIEDRAPRPVQQEPPPADPADPGFDPEWSDNIVPFPSDVPSDAPPEPPAAAEAHQPPRIKITRYNDIAAALDTADLVEDYLGTGAMSVMYGESNSGKTFFATNLAFHIACGWDWNDRHIERTGVIYCALEGAHGINNRIAALKAEYEIEDVPLGVVTVPLDLCQTDEDTTALVAAIKAEAKDIDFPIGFIVMDTVARALAGGNENAPDDMGALVRNGDVIRAQTGAHVMWIHHSGKDQARGARGHSSLRAATDTEIEISAEGSSRTARVTKQREYECSGEFTFSLKVIELGQNKRGKTLTSCVVVSGETRAVGSTIYRRRLTGHTKRALEVLEGVLVSAGRAGDAGVPSGYSSIPEKWWRDRFYDSSMPGEEQDAKQKAFKRATKTLIEEHFVGMAGGRVWVVSKSDTQPDISKMSGMSGEV